VGAERRAAPRVGGLGYNGAVAGPRRDDFPDHFVGDLVKTDRGWVMVPPTCCPNGHDYGDGGRSVSSLWCTCNGRHTAWRCSKLSGIVLYFRIFQLKGSNPAGGTA
jgi:hypothetical protein